MGPGVRRGVSGMEDGNRTAGAAAPPVICGEPGLVPWGLGATVSAPGRVLPLPRLLVHFASSHESGVLTVDDGSSVRTVFFRDGSVVWAESSDAGHRFSEW